MNSPSEVLVVADTAAWRDWLAEYADFATQVWLVMPRKGEAAPGPSYHDAVRQALCFGWIDGTRRRHDQQSSVMRFTPRRKGSRWSASNRARVEELAAARMMRPRGQREIDLARERGTWEPEKR